MWGFFIPRCKSGYTMVTLSCKCLIYNTFRWAHNPKVVSSNLTPATSKKALLGTLDGLFGFPDKYMQ